MTTAGVHDNGCLSCLLSCGHSNGSCLLAVSVAAVVRTTRPPAAAARVDQGYRTYATTYSRPGGDIKAAHALVGHADLASPKDCRQPSQTFSGAYSIQAR
jgi:hypothetical protein